MTTRRFVLQLALALISVGTSAAFAERVQQKLDLRQSTTHFTLNASVNGAPLVLTGGFPDYAGLLELDSKVPANSRVVLSVNLSATAFDQGSSFPFFPLENIFRTLL